MVGCEDFDIECEGFAVVEDGKWLGEEELGGGERERRVGRGVGCGTEGGAE